MTHSTHRVSCKVALYNEDFSKVLVAEYNPGNFGLPGGHLEGDETPDDAIARELQEELGLSGIVLRHGDFIRHFDGKVVLYFYGTIKEDTKLYVDLDEMSAVRWVPVKDIQTKTVNIDMYRDFVLSNVPGV